MPTGPLADATAVVPAGDGTYRGSIAAGWDIAGKAMGGYLLAMGARGPVTATGRLAPQVAKGCRPR
jgi:hypothetical protein